MKARIQTSKKRRADTGKRIGLRVASGLRAGSWWRNLASHIPASLRSFG